MKRDFDEMCLMITLNDFLIYRLFKIIFIFLFLKRIMIIRNILVDNNYIEVYVVINEIIILRVCEKL